MNQTMNQISDTSQPKLQLTLTIYFTSKAANPIVKVEYCDKDDKLRQSNLIDLFYQFMEDKELYGHGEIAYWAISIRPWAGK